MEKNKKTLLGLTAVLGLATLVSVANVKQTEASFWDSVTGKEGLKQDQGQGPGQGPGQDHRQEQGPRQDQGQGPGQGKQGENKDVVRDAIESGSYEAFQTAIKGTPLAEAIDTEEKFNQLIESNNLAKAGNLEEANAIKEDLGIKDSPRKQEKERRDVMKEVVESADFSKFQELMKDDPISKIIDTEEEFEKFIEARKLVAEGSYDEARAIYTELGLKAPEHFREEKKTEMKEILESSDYEAFVAAVSGKPVAEIIDTEEKFAQLVKAHNLMNQGDIEGAREILESLGF